MSPNEIAPNFKTWLSSWVGLPYEKGGGARRIFLIKPLKETNLGVAQPLKAIILNYDYMNRVNKTNWKL